MPKVTKDEPKTEINPEVLVRNVRRGVARNLMRFRPRRFLNTKVKALILCAILKA
jgi:hypothetical protein